MLSGRTCLAVLESEADSGKALGQGSRRLALMSAECHSAHHGARRPWTDGRRRRNLLSGERDRSRRGARRSGGADACLVPFPVCLSTPRRPVHRSRRRSRVPGSAMPSRRPITKRAAENAAYKCVFSSPNYDDPDAQKRWCRSVTEETAINDSLWRDAETAKCADCRTTRMRPSRRPNKRAVALRLHGHAVGLRRRPQAWCMRTCRNAPLSGWRPSLASAGPTVGTAR